MTSMPEFLRKVLYTVSEEIGTRPIGSEGNLKTRKFLMQCLRDLGYSVETQAFQKSYSSATQSLVRLVSLNRTIDSWPAFASCSGSIVAPTLDCGEGTETDLDEVRGVIALIRRGGIHEAKKLQLLSERGAKGALLYVDYENALYSARVSQTQSQIPAAIIRPNDARWISSLGRQEMELQVVANTLDAECANIIAMHPRWKNPTICICAHYDSRPNTHGANDNAAGVASLLGVARKLAETGKLYGVQFILFDGEEIGLVGSQHYATSTEAQRFRYVLNIDAVGDGRLSCLIKDRDGPLDANLAERALKIAKNRNIALKTAAARTGISDHAPFRVNGAQTFWLSDHPNMGRETDLDIADNIQLGDLNAVVELTYAMVDDLSVT